MSAPSPRKSEWTSPALFTMLIQLFGFAGMAFAGFMAFKDNSAASISELRGRVMVLERVVDRLEKTR